MFSNRITRATLDRRLDAEFLQPEFLENEKRIEACGLSQKVSKESQKSYVVDLLVAAFMPTSMCPPVFPLLTNFLFIRFP